MQLTNSVVPDPEVSSPHSQQPTNGSYPEPGESTPHPPQPVSPRSILIPLLSTPWFSKWTFSLRLSHQNPVHVSPHSHACHMPNPPHSPRFQILLGTSNQGESNQLKIKEIRLASCSTSHITHSVKHVYNRIPKELKMFQFQTGLLLTKVSYKYCTVHTSVYYELNRKSQLHFTEQKTFMVYCFFSPCCTASLVTTFLSRFVFFSFSFILLSIRYSAHILLTGDLSYVTLTTAMLMLTRCTA
jgi:hypothetical protein